MRLLAAFLVTLALCGRPAVAQGDWVSHMVPLEKCVRIEISPPSYWTLSIEPNGSGHLTERERFTEIDLPEKSFSFDEVYRGLSGLPVTDSGMALGHNRPTKTTVIFYKEGTEPGHGKSVENDETYLVSLFQKARSAAGAAFTPAMTKLWNTHPPISPKKIQPPPGPTPPP